MKYYKHRLLGIWYAIILVILVSVLYEHTTKFDFQNFWFWIRLMFFMVALILTLFVVQIIFKPNSDVGKLRGLFDSQIKKKDGIIKKLKLEKEMFMKSALKRSEENQRLKERFRRH